MSYWEEIVFERMGCRWIDDISNRMTSTTRLIRGVSVVISPNEVDPPRSLTPLILYVLPKAFFTREQIDCVVDDLKERAREESKKARFFVSDSEWVDIDKV